MTFHPRNSERSWLAVRNPELQHLFTATVTSAQEHACLSFSATAYATNLQQTGCMTVLPATRATTPLEQVYAVTYVAYMYSCCAERPNYRSAINVGVFIPFIKSPNRNYMATI